MEIFAKEHYDLMIQFEREHSGRFDKEAKEFWPKGIVYQDGHINELFLAYRRGYAFCEADMRSDIQNLEASRDGYRADAERDAARLDWLERHDGRFYNKDRISSIVGTGFLVASDEQGARHQTVRAAIDAAIAAQRKGDA